MHKRAITAAFIMSGLGASLGVGDSAATTTASDDAKTQDLVVVDRAATAGLGAVSRSYSATPVDYNRDGAQDVWIGYHAQGGRLWRNEGNGTYRRVAASAWPQFDPAGKQIDRHDCAWADVDRNDRPDAYCSTGRFAANHVKYGRDNELWMQGRRGRFTEVGTAWGVGDVCGRGRQVAFLNANGDNYPDLFLGNETPRDVRDDPCNKPGNDLPNERGKIFINTGGTGFRYGKRFWDFGAGPGHRCAEVLDFNGDGWDDLLTCGADAETPRLYRNRAGRRFADVSSAHRLDRPVNDAVVADLDGDRDRDLVIATVRGFAYHLNTDGRFGAAVWIGFPSSGEGRSVAVGDADRDGDLDVYGMVGDGQQSNPDDVIWVNNRLSFTPASVPSAGGAADDVIALKPRGTGRAEFLALNGFGRSDTPAGPVQLIRAIRH